MFDKAMQARAETEGWKLVTTFNNGDDHPFLDIVPATSITWVIQRAKTGSLFHQGVLRMVAESRLRASKPKGKK